MPFDRLPNDNDFHLTGIIHAEPERGTGKSDPHVPYCRLLVRSDSPYFDGHWRHNYSYFKVVLFRDKADIMAKAVLGDGVALSGSLSNQVSRTEEDKAASAVIELNVRRVQWLPATVKRTKDDDEAPITPF
jgi:single-stranded DNA-binding protein